MDRSGPIILRESDGQHMKDDKKVKIMIKIVCEMMI